MTRKNSIRPLKRVKAKQNSVASLKTAWALRACHLQSICADIKSRGSSYGCIPWGEITKLLNGSMTNYTWLIVDIIKKAWRYIRANVGNLETVVSDLTDLTGNTGATEATNAPSLIPPPSSVGFLNTETNKNKVGRPMERKSKWVSWGKTVEVLKSKLPKPLNGL